MNNLPSKANTIFVYKSNVKEIFNEYCIKVFVKHILQNSTRISSTSLPFSFVEIRVLEIPL